MSSFVFSPRLLLCLKNYSWQHFYKDLMAGIIVGIVALPLAIAFGIASGVSPEKGLITAIVGGFIVSALGGSSVQIGGPTGAFIIIVYGIIETFGLSGLAVATFMAGLLLLVMGFLKLGSIIKFIPYPIIVGFTAGIGLTIFTTQIPDLMGLQIEKIPGSFIAKWIAYAGNISSVNFWALGIGLVSILIIVYTPKFSKKIPGSLIAIILMTVVSYFLKTNLGVEQIETIGDRFQISASLPAIQSLSMDFATFRLLLPSAFTIAMLAAIESLLSASVADGVIGEQHDSNTELIAQGMANVVIPFLGGIPVTGAIARTMTNINNGGRTPVAGIIHAFVLLLILLFLSPLTKHIPMACLAGVLVVVSYNMSNVHIFRKLLSHPKSDVLILLITFALTVLLDLTIAIEVGMLLAMVMLLKRVTESTRITVFRDKLKPNEGAEVKTEEEHLIIPKQVEVYEIDGPYFFGIANKFDEIVRQLGSKPQVRIIRMRKVPFMDSTGINNLTSLIKISREEHIHVVLSGVNEDVRNTLIAGEVQTLLDEQDICADIYKALERAKALLLDK
ncbi:sulfate permease [Porphyromonas macacae]|uniref:SulP family inorganic anion transporter n=1 Tax=Porphyromonas macacae TaxID=28115 RepID=UPI00052CCE60|nr:SulP family inorganic anion transporter [Porphyromonas macacae]KGN97182.1 sulfate permease [Porphyromonas macacae]